MELIDKDALVAEIDNMLKTKEQTSHLNNDAFNSGRWKALKKVKDILNTIGVKEVDLEKAIDDYIYTHDGRKRLALELDWKYCSLTLKDGNEIIKFAKHFFELGIQIGNKAQKGD